MKNYKPTIRKNMELKALEDKSIIDTIFELENIDIFDMGHHGSTDEINEYIDFLKKSNNHHFCLGIHHKDKLVGFIMATGNDCHIVGGVHSDYRRKGLYTAARNTVIKKLNDKGIFVISSILHTGSKSTEVFLKGVPQTRLGDLWINHFDVEKPICKCEDFHVKVNKTKRHLYHISFNPNLPDIVRPKAPDGSDPDNVNEYHENLPPRFCTAPSVELCLRAIYPVISHLLEEENEPEITFSIYKVISGKVDYYPADLVENEYLHDGHVTLEHVFLTPVFIKKIGKVTFENTSDDHGLWYSPYMRGEKHYNSPRHIVAKIH